MYKWRRIIVVWVTNNCCRTLSLLLKKQIDQRLAGEDTGEELILILRSGLEWFGGSCSATDSQNEYESIPCKLTQSLMLLRRSEIFCRVILYSLIQNTVIIVVFLNITYHSEQQYSVAVKSVGSNCCTAMDNIHRGPAVVNHSSNISHISRILLGMPYVRNDLMAHNNIAMIFRHPVSLNTLTLCMWGIRNRISQGTPKGIWLP